MAKRTSKGRCSFCDATFNKGTMIAHLKSCNQAKVTSEISPGKMRSQKTNVFHLVVEGRYQPVYWMQLSAPAHAPLKDLDNSSGVYG